MPNFSVISKASLYLVVAADNSKEAFQLYSDHMANWSDAVIGGTTKGRNVEGVFISPSDLNLDAVQIMNFDDEGDTLVVEPTKDAATELQPLLLEYIREADANFCMTPEMMIVDETPAELLCRAKEFFYHLRNHIMKEWGENHE